MQIFKAIRYYTLNCLQAGYTSILHHSRFDYQAMVNSNAFEYYARLSRPYPLSKRFANTQTHTHTHFSVLFRLL